jgi:hypothetical protein
VDLALLDRVPARPMTAAEDELARSFYAAVQHATNNTARSLQSAGHRIGVSDLGFCSERVRRHILGESEPDVDHLPAFIGTALGDHIEQAVSAMFPNVIRQAEVDIVLHGDTGTFVLTGHPDVIDPAGRLIDIKTCDGLGRVRRTGPSQQQQFQRHCYAKAAHQAGLFHPGVALTDVTVSDIWFDRSAREREAYVHTEPYDERVVEAATIWLDDVVYAFQHGDAARKEPPREMCYAACGFAPECRSGDTDVRGLITDAEQLAAVSMYREAVEMERDARKLKDEAKNALTGVIGSTGRFTIRWVKVGGSHVEFDRMPYERLDVRPLPAPKA